MNWKNVKLIAVRELRDQMRDRRTLFVIAVLPLLLYPLLGMAMLQITQFLKEHASVVWIVGEVPEGPVPSFLDEGTIRSEYCTNPREAWLIQVVRNPEELEQAARREARISEALESGEADLVVVMPKDWDPGALPRAESSSDGISPEPAIYYHQAKDRSRIAMDRVAAVLDRWKSAWIDSRLRDMEVPRDLLDPFGIRHFDVARPTSRSAVLWSRFLPFVLMIWALTGAFYPAIDLCAGEKERGTLETLLCSPARREEIVWGKLLTVMAYSMATSALNLVCMLFTGLFVMRQLSGLEGAGGIAQIGPPPVGLSFWLIFALPPISALFSALAIALAAMARSTKEGQYYLIPLMVVSMPLMMLPALPSVELDLGNSLIPLTGMILLLRSLIEGEYWLAIKYVLPVAMVTALACWMAIRWAVSQFNDEDVLFREGEQFQIKLWLVHLIRDRRQTPSVAAAFLCAVLLLVIRFFAMFVLPSPASWRGFVVVQLILQLCLIAAPAMLMAIFFTRSVKRTLLFQLPRASGFLAATSLAIVIHPLATSVGVWLRQLYPLSEQARAQLQALEQPLNGANGIWNVILLLALIPAICEELAFRGFILSGMRHLGHRWMAILLTSIFFGLAHGILQQSLNALLLGLILGYIAVQTGSLLPCIGFHFVHNALQCARPAFLHWTDGTRLGNLIWNGTVAELGAEHVTYYWPWVVVSFWASVIWFRWIRTMPFQLSPEERLQHSLDQAAQVPLQSAS